MPITTTKQVRAEDKAYSGAWNEEPKKPELCKACKTPGYCAEQGCQKKAAELAAKAQG